MARARASGRWARARVRRLALWTGVLAVVVLAVVTATRRGGSEEPSREGSTLLAAHPPGPLAAGRRPTAYRISYKLRAGGQRAQGQEVAVLRPFDSRTATRSAGRREQVREASFGRLAVSSGGEATVLAASPTVADSRIEAVVSDAQREGRLERRERRRVAGQACDVFRSAGGPSVDHFASVPARGRTYTDWCIDARGLVVERRTVESGRVTEELVATRVEAGFALGADDVRRLPLEQTVPPVEGGGSVRPARTDSAPSTRFFEPTVDPPGLARRGRYSVVPPQAAIAQQEQRGAAVAETDDVWTSADGDMVVLAQGGRLDATRALPPVPDATAVSLGPLGAGEELLSPQGCELRVTLPASGRYVRLYGTIGVSRLVAFAQTLRDTPGGSGLVFLNG